ncbi:hypothetical protein [Deinococcus maricopensis]|uniref:Uncharacterized protein n=1 Tax=Deinococcus maricopensis (strain DSM 21211 / LMG 22137 / NRRL B-23946 / LB-34) TaxID=709986 RepID=E8UA34_DEIML|nr:hypothetical protein [Deinococcus maricopensis]ADV67923.1 hypothetical protein Deima_2285 [Deinococcus maricopensis DSM 21211]
MTRPNAGEQLRSTASGRYVIPGWTQVGGEKPDAIEVQFDVADADLARESGLMLVEYWATPEEITLQTIVPFRAFRETKDGWCVFVPAVGKLIVRVMDPQPTPPVLATHWLNLDPNTQPGTTVNINIHFNPRA